MTPEDIAKGFDEIRQLLRETAEVADRRAEEAARRSVEIDRQLAEMAQAADRRAEEAARRSAEVDRQLQENAQQMRETNRQFQKIQRLIRKSFLKTDRKIRELTDLFTNQ